MLQAATISVNFVYLHHFMPWSLTQQGVLIAYIKDIIHLLPTHPVQISVDGSVVVMFTVYY